MSSCAIHVATTTGHDGFPPTTSISSSNKLIVGGHPAVLEGDTFNQHCKPGSGCHSGVAVASSSKMIVGGKSVCVQGDKLSCGDTIASGSSMLVI